MEALAPKVNRNTVIIGDKLGQGGQGQVFEIHAPLIDRKPTAVKFYSKDALDKLNVTALEELVDFARRLSLKDKKWLYDNYAWPASIVVEGDDALGFLMRKVPQECFFDYHTQTQGVKQKLSDIAFLLNPEDYVRKAGLWVADRDRLIFLETVATNLSRLHSLDIVIGDLSAKNVLLRRPRSSFFIDCDSFRFGGETALEQLETNDWEAPTDEPKATRETDSYKFGLLAIRLFARDQATEDTSAIERMSPKLGKLARLSLSEDPESRPTPGQWIDDIKHVVRSIPLSSGTPKSARPGTAVPPGGANGQTRVYRGKTTSGTVTRSPVDRFSTRNAFLIFGGLIALILILIFVILPALTGSSPPVGAATNPAAKQEATTINTLLDQSAASQLELEIAMNHIFACSDVAGNDSQVNMVVGQRTSELSEASGLPVAALANGTSLKSYLVEVLRISLHADEDYRSWANGVMAHGCNAQNLWTPAYTNGYAQTQNVVAAKLNFLPLWNNVAGMYGFPPRSQSDI